MRESMAHYEAVITSGNSNNVLGDLNIYMNLTTNIADSNDRLPHFQSQEMKNTFLLIAADKNKPAWVQQLLDQGADYKHVDDDEETALYKAVRCRAAAVIDILLACPTRAAHLLNYREFAYLYAPLHYACWRGFTDIAQQLLMYDAPLEARQRSGHTALFLAAKHGRYEALDLLLRKGANPLALNHNHDLPIHIAARNGGKAVLERLLKFQQVRTSLERQNRSGDPPLYLATWHGHEDCARLLINSGADVHFVNKPSNTNLLHTATRGGLDELLDDMLPQFSMAERKAYSTHFQATPLQLAVKEKQTQCEAVLRRHMNVIS